MNPLANKHPDPEGFSCEGTPQGHGPESAIFTACRACGAFLENGLVTGHNLTAALACTANSDRPETAFLLQTEPEHGELSLWLIDAAGQQEGHILAIKTQDGREVSGLVSELAAMARAILAYQQEA